MHSRVADEGLPQAPWWRHRVVGRCRWSPLAWLVSWSDAAVSRGRRAAHAAAGHPLGGAAHRDRPRGCRAVDRRGFPRHRGDYRRGRDPACRRLLCRASRRRVGGLGADRDAADVRWVGPGLAAARDRGPDGQRGDRAVAGQADRRRHSCPVEGGSGVRRRPPRPGRRLLRRREDRAAGYRSDREVRPGRTGRGRGRGDGCLGRPPGPLHRPGLGRRRRRRPTYTSTPPTSQACRTRRSRWATWRSSVR